MEATIDKAGRIVVPKSLRDALGLSPGTTLDVSTYGAGLTLIPHGRTASVVDEEGLPVLDSDHQVTDEDIFGLIDAGRR